MTFLSERQYNQAVGKILAGKALEPDEAQHFVATISKLESLLDEADNSDTFGSEGWKHMINWD